MAFGEIGLDPEVFYKMSPAEFFLTLRGWQKKGWKEWEHTRLIAYTTFAMAPRKKRTRTPKMFSWLPLPTDQKKAPDEKHMANVMKLFREQRKKVDNG